VTLLNSLDDRVISALGRKKSMIGEIMPG
jgi:hypothetical protein